MEHGVLIWIQLTLPSSTGSHWHHYRITVQVTSLRLLDQQLNL